MGFQFFSSKKSDPKKYLVIEDGKKIWREERLLTEASKKAFLAKLLKNKAAWLKQIAEQDIPSCSDTDDDDKKGADLDLDLCRPRSSTPVECRLSRTAGKLPGLSPEKEELKTGGKRKLTYSSKPVTTMKSAKKTPPLRFKPDSPLSLESSPKLLSPVKASLVSAVKTPAAEKRPREPDTVFSSIKKLFSFSKGKVPAGQLPLEIVDDVSPGNLDWQTQGL